MIDDLGMWLVWGIWVAVGLVAALATLAGTFFMVDQQSAAMVERFHRFVRIGRPGLNVKWPFIERVAGRPSLRVQQFDVKVETKTHDNVFVHLIVSVQYYVLDAKIYEAFYRLADATKQIQAYVFDLVRARVPHVLLDALFEKKDEIADAVNTELGNVMDDFGYGILKALVTDIEPDAKVKESMNEINAAQRLRVAATEQGEAHRILQVKTAEGEAQSKALQGQGIADQRRAIINGLRDSIDSFQQGVPGTTSQDVMAMVLLTQYFDTLKEIGANNKSSTILIPHSPGTLGELYGQLRNALIVAEKV